jgi:hypothetical protein
MLRGLSGWVWTSRERGGRKVKKEGKEWSWREKKGKAAEAYLVVSTEEGFCAFYRVYPSYIG